MKRFPGAGAFFRSLLPFLAALTPLAPEAESAEIVRVLPEFREEESFHRIPEFFTGREFTGRRDILRSEPDTREGFYLTVRLRRVNRALFPSGTARVEVALPDEHRPVEFEYSLETVDRRRPLILLGITGGDWPEDLERPLAWRVSFFDEEDRLLDSEKSFLWSLDEEPWKVRRKN